MSRRRPPPDEEPLELRLLASGATQHVFVRLDRPADGWVYKTPAILDPLLPSRPAVSRLAPEGRGKRLAIALLYRLPRRAWRRLCAGRGPVARAGRRLGIRLARAYVRTADRLLSLYLRRARVAAFHRMLRIHREMASAGPARVALLPWRELARARATLHAVGSPIAYRGPILAQRRADLFFDGLEALEHFDQRQLVHAQHLLWKCGVALADAAGALGPEGWALLDGHIHLADTGSLTDDFRLASRVLSPEILDALQAGRLARQPHGAPRERAREYHERVRAQISRRRLAELWRADAPRPPPGGRGNPPASDAALLQSRHTCLRRSTILPAVPAE